MPYIAQTMLLLTDRLDCSGKRSLRAVVASTGKAEIPEASPLAKG